MSLSLSLSSPIRSLIVSLCMIFAFLPLKLLALDPQLMFTKVSLTHTVTDIVNAGDGSNRVFMTQQSGRIFILKGTETLEEPFLDIRSRVLSGGERGLLSMAFAPDYKTSGNFYVWYTKLGGPTVLARFSVSEDPDIADANSEQIILTVHQPQANHNGGRLQFGQDGMLYLGLGDGGGSNDPQDNSQDGSTLLGKLIRIDVDPTHGTYAVPPDNPFVGNAAVKDEIWALGLRNPWRISFDSQTGDLYIADVGQENREEVNFQSVNSTGGENYGWDLMEGSLCPGGNCNLSKFTLPVAEYNHDNGCSITGGEVYRGEAYPNMHGSYLFADFCSGMFWSLKRNGGTWVMTPLVDTSWSVMTFGLGEDNSVYFSARPSGVYLISDGDIRTENLTMNAGFNDAWFNPLTDGQGFYITVYPDLGIVNVAWFTYDTMLPPEDATANLGDPGQRWFNATGSFSGREAVLQISMTSGGIFDTATVIERTDPPGSDGTLTLIFNTCNSGIIIYDIPSINMVGEVPIQRISTDNVVVCEALMGE